LNPSWNETFNKFKRSDVGQLDRIRFEVWDKDFLSKDFMGSAEVSVAEIREKQLIERKTTVVRGSISADYTQEPINFHLKLQPLEGKSNAGANLVSGFIDVRIRYYKLSGVPTGAFAGPVAIPIAQPIAAPAAAAAPKSSHPGAFLDEDIDFGIEHTGQTGSKRRPPSESPTLKSAAPSIDEVSSVVGTVGTVSLGIEEPPTPHRSCSLVIADIEKGSNSQWQEIVGSIKLVAPSNAAAPSTSHTSISVSTVPASGSNCPIRRAFKRQPTLRGIHGPKGALTHDQPPSVDAGAAKKKNMRKTESRFNIFSLE
jgi:hypothetical protein